MVLYHKWDVKNDFAYMLQFFSLIFDGLGSVNRSKISQFSLDAGFREKSKLAEMA